MWNGVLVIDNRIPKGSKERKKAFADFYQGHSKLLT